MPGRRLPGYTATALICALMGVVVFRAKTQSFTIDEAFAFNLYIDKPIAEFFTVYDTCNHVLHTLLTKFVRYWLGTSELVLRLVSIVGALLFFIVVRRLCRIAAGSGWTHVVGIAALGLNPLILDFLVAARGYGLAIALFLWAIYYAVRWLNEGGEAAHLWRTGLAGGLAIAANLTLLVPVAALGAILLILAIRRGQRGVWAVVDNFGGPAIVVAFLLVVLPLTKSTADNFYLGRKTLGQAVASIWDPSFRYDPERLPAVSEAVVIRGREIALPIMFAAMAGAALFVISRRIRTDSPDLTADLFMIATATLALSVVELALLHRFFSVPYPYSRSGLYLVPSFLLALLAGTALLTRKTRTAVAGLAGTGLLTAMAVIFALQINLRYFAEWRFDAATNRLVDVIVADSRANDWKPFTVGGSRLCEQSLKYYRKRRKLHNMSPEVATRDLECATVDYFFLVNDDRHFIAKLGLHILAEDPLSGTVVARRS